MFKVYGVRYHCRYSKKEVFVNVSFLWLEIARVPEQQVRYSIRQEYKESMAIVLQLSHSGDGKHRLHAEGRRKVIKCTILKMFYGVQ